MRRGPQSPLLMALILSLLPLSWGLVPSSVAYEALELLLFSQTRPLGVSGSGSLCELVLA
jgi:hypothetical protein